MTPMKLSQRRVTSWVLRAAASAVLLWLLMRRLDLSHVGGLLRHMQVGWLAAALGVMLVSRVLSCLRLIILVRAKGIPYDAKIVSRIVLAAEFYGAFLPTSIGGDAVRLVGLTRHTAKGIEAGSAVFVERAIGVFGLLVFGVIGTLWAWPRLHDHAILWAALAPSVVGLLVAAAAMKERWASFVLRWSGLLRVPWAGKLLAWQQAVRAYRRQPLVVVQVLAVTLGIHFLRILAVYLAAVALGAALPFAPVLAFVPLILLISLLPISVGGFGVRENAFVHCFGQVGASPAMAFSISIVAHTLSVIAHIPGGLWSVWDTGQRAPAAAPRRPADRRLRVLWLSDKLGYGDRLHGGGRYFLTVVPALRDVHVIPVALRSTNGLARQFEDHGIQLRELHQARFDPRTFFALVRLIRTEQVDLLQVHGYGASTFGRLAGWLTGRPVILRQSDSDPAPWQARVADFVCSPLTARVIVVSKSVQRFCVAKRFIPLHKVTVLPNPVTPKPVAAPEELQRLRDAWRLSPDAKIVGSVTRFHPVKGVEYLVEAMPDVARAVPAAHLVLWGDGPGREQLEARAQTLGVAHRVHFAGYQPDATRYLPLVDCFVLPSLSEGTPNAVLEALTVGRPVVATAAGGTPEIVRDQEEALLVPPRDHQALARSIIRVLNDAALATRLGQAALAASRRFAIERYTADLCRLYQGLVS